MAVGDARPKTFYGPAQPGAADTTLLTVPAGKRWTVTSILLANTDAGTRSITLGKGGVSAVQQIVPNSNVSANTPSLLRVWIPLEAGESIHGSQGAAFVTVTISGVEEDTA